MSRDVVTLVIPARTEYLIVARLALAGIARGTPIDDGALADLKLAVTEACGNAIRHAQPTEQGVVRVDFDLDERAVHAHHGAGQYAGQHAASPSPERATQS